MKKLLILLVAAMISFNTVVATEEITQPEDNSSIQKERMQRRVAFEKRLGLTEEQKLQARELRIKSHETMKPIMDEIRLKKQEEKMVKLSRISVQMQEEKLAKIDGELKILEKQLHALRVKNMKEFEKILTKEQKKILKQMKQEGRDKYRATHPESHMMKNISPNQTK